MVRRVSRQNENMISDTSFWQNDPPGVKLSFWRLTSQTIADKALYLRLGSLYHDIPWPFYEIKRASV